MRYKLVLLTCLFAVLGAKAQTNEVQLDADGIMRVGAPVTIVTIGNSITAGYSNTSPSGRGRLNWGGCGAVIEAHDIFCPACGNKIDKTQL